MTTAEGINQIQGFETENNNLFKSSPSGFFSKCVANCRNYFTKKFRNANENEIVLPISTEQEFQNEITQIFTSVAKDKDEENSSGRMKPICCSSTNFPTLSFLKVAPHKSHKFYNTKFIPKNVAKFQKYYLRDLNLLQENLPEGILVKAYEDRMDLFSALILGPKNTPYEGGLFLFEIQLPSDYPDHPPSFHFISYTSQNINPNLYSYFGKVCISLLGTWPALHRCEKWSKDSSLLQVLLSIQGLILVDKPYFNEPAYASHMNDSKMVEPCRQYNEDVLSLLARSIVAQLQDPPLPWKEEITTILKTEIPKLIDRLENWLEISLSQTTTTTDIHSQQCGVIQTESSEILPQYSLLPFKRNGLIRKSISILRRKHFDIFGK